MREQKTPERATAELRDQKGWFDATLASVGDAVLTIDRQAHVRLLNPVAEFLTGWSLAEAEGRPLSEVFQIVDERTRQPAENPALRALKEGRVIELPHHAVLLCKDGTERIIDDSAAP